MYYHGRGVEQDDQQAVEWFRRAADKGLPRAQYNLGVTYRDGRGVEQDYQQAVEWFRRAADQGHPPAKRGLAQANILLNAARAV
jgi:TPR repeat protein